MESEKIVTDLMKRIRTHKYLCITLIEIFIFLIGSIAVLSQRNVKLVFDQGDIKYSAESNTYDTNEINAENAKPDSYLFIPEQELNKGIYNITIDYASTSNNNACEFSYHSEIAFGALIDRIPLNNYCNQKVSTFWVNQKLQNFRTLIKYGNDGDLKVDKVTISTAWNSKLYQIFRLMVFWLIVNGLTWLWFNWRKIKKENFYVALGLFAAVAISSSGLFVQYYLDGHDLVYHLLRIEGLKDGLMSGAFPVRIHPNWVNGWGYAAPIMYGDATLIVPALLRIIGVNVQNAYKCYIIYLNILTAAFAYYSFMKMSKSKYTGIVCSIIYTIAPYRLLDIYTRAAFGEYAAMTFFPLIALGIWHAFIDDVDDKDYMRKWIAPVIGFTGLIQSHTLSTEMVGLFIILICIIGIKKVIRKQTFWYLAKIVIYTTLVNLWFLVPMLSYFGEKLVVFSSGYYPIQSKGVNLTELFAPFTTGFYGFYWDGIVSLGNKPAITLGIVFVVIFILYLWTSNQKKKWKYRKIACAVSGLGILSVYMVTIYFPYDKIMQWSEITTKLLGIIRLPYRFLSISNILLTVLACIILMTYKKKKYKKQYLMIVILLLSVSMFQSSDYIYKILLWRTDSPVVYAGERLNTNTLIGAEFLYEGSNTDVPFSDNEVHGYGVTVENYTKKYNNISMHCSGVQGDSAYVEVPLFCYKGYVAYDQNSKEHFRLEHGDANRIRVYLPDGYEGDIRGKFEEPALWRVSEIISILAILLLVLLYNKDKIKQLRQVKPLGEFQ